MSVYTLYDRRKDSASWWVRGLIIAVFVFSLSTPRGKTELRSRLSVECKSLNNLITR